MVCQLCVSLHTALACLPRARAKRGGLSGRAGTCWTGKVTATWTPWPSSTQAPGQRKPLVADPDPVVSGSSCVCRCPHPSGPLGAEVDDQWSKKGRAGQQIAWPHSHPELPDYCSPRHLRNRKSGTLEQFFFFFFFGRRVAEIIRCGGPPLLPPASAASEKTTREGEKKWVQRRGKRRRAALETEPPLFRHN